MWDLIVSVPDHCLSFYFAIEYSSCIITVLNLDFYVCCFDASMGSKSFMGTEYLVCL